MGADPMARCRGATQAYVLAFALRRAATIGFVVQEAGYAMAISIKSLGIDRLAVEDRLDLVEQIWDSIAADNIGLPLTDAQRIELERRIADHEQNPDDVVSWDEIRAAVSKHLP